MSMSITNEPTEARKCSNPACPLRRAHSGPCAPSDWKPGAPSEAQVEAAAKAMWDLRKLISDPEWDALEYGVKQEYRKDARAALVAAQGATTEELAKIKPLFENLSREYPNECNKRVKAEAERDAAVAAIERVRAIHVRHKDTHKPDPSVINGNWFCCGAVQLGAVDPYACIACDSPEWPCPTLAALDVAPEPEEIAEQDAAVAAMEQDECTLPGHAGCMQVKVDGELWIDHFPSERGADTDGESK